MQLLMGVSDLSDSKHMPFYFNVTCAVGPGQPNKPDDVYLVQYMLHVLLSDERFPYHAQAPKIKGDGICGPKTRAAIRLFQKWVKNYVHYDDMQIQMDGIVSPAQARRYHDGTHVYTIIAMNMIYAGMHWDSFVKKYPMTKTEQWMNSARRRVA